MKVAVTGGQGFIGSQLIRTLLTSGHRVLNLDKGTYAAHPANLLDVEEHPDYTRLLVDICDAPRLRQALHTFQPDAVINCAAETHVDRSLKSAISFIENNVIGLQTVLDVCRDLGIGPIVHLSTDEVMGETPEGERFDESAALNPSSPYAGSKAAAESMIRAAVRTYDVDVRIVRSANNYGPRQYPEKLIPLMILRALEYKSLPLYGDGLQIRDWLHVEDNARAILTVLERGEKSGIYCVGSRTERTNAQIVEHILATLQRPRELIEYVHDRPGHDRRYALDPAKIEALGWSPRISFEVGLRDTILWYQRHRSWLEAVRLGAFQEFHAEWNDDASP